MYYLPETLIFFTITDGHLIPDMNSLESDPTEVMLWKRSTKLPETVMISNPCVTLPFSTMNPVD